MNVQRIRPRGLRRSGVWLPLAAAALALAASAGCYAPVHSYGIPAHCLPDSFRTPVRSTGVPLNYTSLSLPPQKDYILGGGDVLEVTVHGLYPNNELRPLKVQVLASGDVQLPVVGAVNVGGKNLMQAQVAITKAYENGFIKEPRTSVYLVEKATVSVMVMGEVIHPGVFPLSKYENDVAHALASAGGLTDDSATWIEVHRRVTPQEAAQAALIEQLRAAEGLPQTPPGAPAGEHSRIEIVPEPIAAAPEPGAPPPPPPAAPVERLPVPPGTPANSAAPARIVKIPLRGPLGMQINPRDILLNPGDVLVVPHRRSDVFFVVGRLSPSNFIKFSVNNRDRELGNALIIPKDKDIDVVTGVTMAGYIDPIESPTTVTVHRVGPDGQPLLILVDLIKARYDRRETVLIEPGDIIYLNPDGWWWGRRTFDRIVPDLIIQPYRRLIGFGGGDS